MTAPERIALRWETGAAVTNGPLMTHPDYTRYIREDVAKPRVKPLVWRGDTDFWRAQDGLGGYYEVMDANAGVYLTHMVDGTGRIIPASSKRNQFHDPEQAQAAAQADHDARVLSLLVLP